jgi:lipoate-protein ligase B
LLLVEFERIAYSLALELQRRVVHMKLSRGAEDVLLLLEHPPTVTLGLRGSLSDLLVSAEYLAAKGIAVHETDRGGQATYHGPGQLVVYPIVTLRSAGLSVRGYVHALEETILRTLEHFAITGFRKDRSPGIWTGPDDKIGSIGVKIRRGIAYHGLSINVHLQEDPTQFVVCCGAACTRMVSINELLPQPVSAAQVRRALAAAFAQVFRVKLAPTPAADLLETVRTDEVYG